jgi:hypothetical protein
MSYVIIIIITILLKAFKIEINNLIRLSKYLKNNDYIDLYSLISYKLFSVNLLALMFTKSKKES